MKSEFELIRYNENLPARLEIKRGAISVGSHWHKEIELLYVLDGTLTVNGSSVGADGVFLINSGENHRLTAENAACLILDISSEFAQQFDSSGSGFFEILPGSGAEEEIRSLLWQLSRTVNEKELPALRQFSVITELLHVLFVQCRRERPEATADSASIHSRHIKQATAYIERHFQEDFTENEIAEMLGLHPIYFCTLFRQSTGVPFREYVLKIRLEHAMDALLNRGMSVEDAAKAGGFPSKRTFIAKCKRAYNATPFQLIKQGVK